MLVEPSLVTAVVLLDGSAAAVLRQASRASSGTSSERTAGMVARRSSGRRGRRIALEWSWVTGDRRDVGRLRPRRLDRRGGLDHRRRRQLAHRWSVVARTGAATGGATRGLGVVIA